jgi:Dyp-type peroxidase family
MAAKSLNLSNIQGNIIGGFNKDFQDFLFLKFLAAGDARAWIREILNPKFCAGLANSTSQNVLKFNAQFKTLRAEGIEPETVITSEWTHLAISFHGLSVLGISARTLARFPPAFRAGMANRKKILGDLGANDPQNWLQELRPGNIHALLIVAADTEAQLNLRVDALINSKIFRTGVRVLHREHGRTREDERGHEHFGFKDGVSQPGIRGVTQPTDPLGNPQCGQPGQSLVWPGEFVLGYPTQKSKHKRGVDGPNPDPGPPSKSGPSWTTDGSYLVFRRLAQDVPGFRKQLNDLASANGLTEDLMSAKLMGRYKSGYPLMQREFHRQSAIPPGADPGKVFPALNKSDTLNNNFKFGNDPTGDLCPFAAHIRKANPRDEIISDDAADSESEVQTHRLLRRGIPFGASLGALRGGEANDSRGLLFVCFQKDIQKQFEHVQTEWINNANFPPSAAGATAGPDPIAALTHGGRFHLKSKTSEVYIQNYVKMTGGEYFFSPSLKTLQRIGQHKI